MSQLHETLDGSEENSNEVNTDSLPLITIRRQNNSKWPPQLTLEKHKNC